jgi:hypothetical protein
MFESVIEELLIRSFYDVEDMVYNELDEETNKIVVGKFDIISNWLRAEPNPEFHELFDIQVKLYNTYKGKYSTYYQKY